MKNKDYAPVPAVAAPAVPIEWRKFVGFLAQQTTFPHPAVCICQACTWIKKARALLQSPAVNDSLTSQADCRACVNRGRVNGLSQESFCDSCIWQGMSWRKDHHAPAVPDANPAQWLADEGDMILVPRGLLGAACSSIDKQRPAPKVLEALRYYTMNAPQAPAVPELDPMTRLIVSDPKQLKPKKQEPAVPRKYHEFASVMLDAQPFITAETYGGRYIVAMRFERLGKMQDCHAALLALLQSTEVTK